MAGKEQEVEATVENIVSLLGDFEKGNHAGKDVPAGYIPVQLSTDGEFGAPKLFHIRNYSMENFLDLSITEQQDLPIKVCDMLQECILEKDVDIRQFTEAEVVETLVNVHRKWNNSKIEKFPIHIQESDKQRLREKLGGPEENEEGLRMAEDIIKEYEEGKRKAYINIDLNNLETYDPHEAKKEIEVTDVDGFHCTFSYPRYGDISILRSFVEEAWKDEDNRMARTMSDYEAYVQAEEAYKKGESDKRRFMPKETLDRVKAYNRRKTLFTMICVRAAHLSDFNGQDCRDLPLAQRVKLVTDPRISYNFYKEVDDYFNNEWKIGLKTEIKGKNPFTQEETEFPFRMEVFPLLSASQHTDRSRITVVAK